jgi:hypothetical protein
LRGDIGNTRAVTVRAHPEGIRVAAFAMARLSLDLTVDDVIPLDLPDPLQKGAAN